jgi:hypothetical protein
MLRNDEGETTVAGFDGVRRVFAHVRAPGTRARLAVGLDESVVHRGIDREISIAYVQLALFGMLVLLIAWFGGERLIVRPIRALVRTAARFGRADLHVRASDEPWLAEFQPLAAALDDMAHKLAGREEELRVANQHLDALASRDELTGFANRRGFDRALERAWQKFLPMNFPASLEPADERAAAVDHKRGAPGRRATVRANSPIHSNLIDARTTPPSEPSAWVIGRAAIRPGACCTRLIRYSLSTNSCDQRAS